MQRPLQVGEAAATGDDGSDKHCTATTMKPADEPDELNRLRQRVWSLEVQVKELERAKLTVETSRDDLAKRQTKYHGNIISLKSQVNSLEETVGNQRSQITALQEDNLSLKRQLSASETLLGLTPDRCRASQQSLRQDLLRASQEAQRKESHVHRLRLLVLNKVQEAAEALQFAEMERNLLQGANDGLVEELAVARGLLQQQHAQLEATASASKETAAKLQSAQREVEELRAREQAVQDAAAAATTEAAEAVQRMQMLAKERQQAAANLNSAEEELGSVQNLGKLMFREVKGIVHQLESHLKHFHTRELATIVRQLRDWVARNGLVWEGDVPPLPSPMPSPAPSRTPRATRPAEGGPLVPISIPQSVQKPAFRSFVC